uniref:Putative secreted protein n=1 Tax=Ixodes ricinus TaxID=34613 RepID=A0A6B0TW62_IXORI
MAFHILMCSKSALVTKAIALVLPANHSYQSSAFRHPPPALVSSSPLVSGRIVNTYHETKGASTMVPNYLFTSRLVPSIPG